MTPPVGEERCARCGHDASTHQHSTTDPKPHWYSLPRESLRWGRCYVWVSDGIQQVGKIFVPRGHVESDSCPAFVPPRSEPEKGKGK
jgi:hypothetical protein